MGFSATSINVGINELTPYNLSEMQDLACESLHGLEQKLRIFVLSLINDLQALNPDSIFLICKAVGIFALNRSLSLPT